MYNVYVPSDGHHNVEMNGLYNLLVISAYTKKIYSTSGYIATVHPSSFDIFHEHLRNNLLYHMKKETVLVLVLF